MFKFSGNSDAKSKEALIDILSNRLRCTDVVGTIDNQLAAILPSTPVWGAWKLADDLTMLFPEDVEPPTYEVYSYPTNWQSPENPAAGIVGDEEGKPVKAMEAFFVQSLPWWKRTLDITLCSAGLLVTLPLTCGAAAMVKLSSPGPIFFKQLRTGLGGKPFFIYKFRSMVPDAEEQRDDLLRMNEQDGPAFKISHDPRITGVGRFLRSTSIDELPQLWNILRGDMTLVGPRPLPCVEAAECNTWQRRRLDVTPGLTCIWQIDGRSPRVSFPEWMRMDIRYLLNRNLRNDLKLIFRTFSTVIKRRGAC